MTKKKKIILISLAVTLALALSVGGLVYAKVIHQNVGGDKLIGVGEMGTDEPESYGPVFMHSRSWDTQFIITNPNCNEEDYLTIHWVALIASDEHCIFEGTPEDLDDLEYMDIELIPDYIDFDENGYAILTPHQTLQLSIADIIACICGDSRGYIISSPLDKYTLDITWSGAADWQWWRWAEARPLTGLQKEKCWYVFGEYMDDEEGYWDFGLAISEAKMKVFRSRIPFSKGEMSVNICYA